MRSVSLALAAFGLLLAQTGATLADPGGQGAGGAVPKAAGAAKPAPAKKAAAQEAAKPKAPKIAGNFGQWALVCGEANDQADQEPCSLVQALVERDTQKLVFRVAFAYGPKGNLVLQIDAPTGVALQRALEFSPDATKIYRLPFHTCLPQACRALLVVPDDLKGELRKAQKGTITVFALNGQALQTVTELAGFSEGLAALDKRRAGQ